jgi:hypothetical protein
MMEQIKELTMRKLKVREEMYLMVHRNLLRNCLSLLSLTCMGWISDSGTLRSYFARRKKVSLKSF